MDFLMWGMMSGLYVTNNTSFQSEDKSYINNLTVL